MQCRHCSNTTNLNDILCDWCVQKALQILPADPKERIQIYLLLKESDNFVIRMCVEQLIREDSDAVEEQMLDPTDRMFSTRG